MRYIYGMLAVLIVSVIGVSLAIAGGMGHVNYNDGVNTQEEYAHTTADYMDNHHDSNTESNEYDNRMVHHAENHNYESNTHGDMHTTPHHAGNHHGVRW